MSSSNPEFEYHGVEPDKGEEIRLSATTLLTSFKDGSIFIETYKPSIDIVSLDNEEAEALLQQLIFILRRQK